VFLNKKLVYFELLFTLEIIFKGITYVVNIKHRNLKRPVKQFQNIVDRKKLFGVFRHFTTTFKINFYCFLFLRKYRAGDIA